MHRSLGSGLRSASLIASQPTRWTPSVAVGADLAAEALGTTRAKSSLSTDFLGVPTNHDELQAKRPMSPHLFGVDNSIHYKFPPIALSSITNRVTGVMLSVGMSGVGYVSLTGDLAATIEALKAVPLVLPVFKFSMSFPIVYHTLGGFRHLWWDATCKNFSNEEMETSAKLLFGVSGAASAVLAFVTF